MILCQLRKEARATAGGWLGDAPPPQVVEPRRGLRGPGYLCTNRRPHTCERRPAHTLGLGGPAARLGEVEDGADFLETGRKLVTRVSPALWPAAVHPGPPGWYSRGMRPIRASLFLLLIGFVTPSSSCSWVAKGMPRFVKGFQGSS